MTVGEVPQGPLTGDRLVYAGSRRAVEGDRAVQRGVRRVHEAADHVEFALAQQVQGLGLGQVDHPG